GEESVTKLTRRGATAGLEDTNVRTAAGTCAGDDLGRLVGVDVANRYEPAAGEVRGVGVPTTTGLAGNRVARNRELTDVRAAAGACAGDDCRSESVVEEASGDANATMELGAVGVEPVTDLTSHLRAVGVEGADVRTAA